MPSIVRTEEGGEGGECTQTLRLRQQPAFQLYKSLADIAVCTARSTRRAFPARASSPLPRPLLSLRLDPVSSQPVDAQRAQSTGSGRARAAGSRVQPCQRLGLTGLFL